MNMKELKELIQTDLTSLYETDRVENAVEINKKLGFDFISDNFIPM